MQKRIEINSRIICLLRENEAPAWVRPSMIFEDRWLHSCYTVEMAVKEADMKIKLFLPRKETA